VINLADENTTEGAGMYVEGNIISDAEKLVRNLAAANVTFTNNLMQLPWTGPGGGNSGADPLLKHIPQLSETHFTTWDQAQVIRDWLSPLPASPTWGTGVNGHGQNGVMPLGAWISGEPTGTNNQTTATLTVGAMRRGHGIPEVGWPNGAGYTHYKWRLDQGAWSAETPTTMLIALNGLANGPHRVEVVGKRDSDSYQDDPIFGLDAVITQSRTWMVDTNYVPPSPASSVRINEVLVSNVTAVPIDGAYPDLIELYNGASVTVDLSGMGLTDDLTETHKFTFASGTGIPSGGYLTVAADHGTGGTLLHTGFALGQSGGSVYLFDKASTGPRLLDSVTFGPQETDRSYGRTAADADQFAIMQPTPGQVNN
jgi:hypothetical protein